MSARRAPPRVLVLGGLEPCARAGVLADAATVRALGGLPVTVPTAQTAQGVRTFLWEPAAPRVLAAQVRAARELGPLHALKLGQCPSRETWRALARALAGLALPWVVDPVVRTSRGQGLTRLTPRDYLGLAAPHVTLTPNLDEAAWLLGWARVEDEADQERAALALLAHGFGSVVVKGGHLARGATDLVATAGGLTRLPSRRVRRRPDTRGTGCRFASALAVGLARGLTPGAAAREAKAHVAGYLAGRAP